MRKLGYLDLPHGAGLIILSVAYFSHFAEKIPVRFRDMARAMSKDVDAVPTERQPMLFVEALREMQENCGVANLKMSDYNIRPEEFGALADNAIETMGGLFRLDRVSLSRADVIAILRKAYR